MPCNFNVHNIGQDGNKIKGVVRIVNKKNGGHSTAVYTKYSKDKVNASS